MKARLLAARCCLLLGVAVAASGLDGGVRAGEVRAGEARAAENYAGDVRAHAARASQPSTEARHPGVDTARPAHVVYVLVHGLHTGIAVARADVPADAWPAVADFPDAHYLELGWGDRAYYMNPDPGVWLGVRALFWPTPSTIHAVGVRGTLQQEFPGAEIVALRVTEDGLARLVAFVSASHERDGEGRFITLAPGQRPNARFYASGRRFHLFETCNTWAARGLLAAGLDVDVGAGATAGGLMQQVRALASPTSAHRGP